MILLHTSDWHLGAIDCERPLLADQQFFIDEPLIREFAELEAVQFAHCNPANKDRIWGLFGEGDTLAHFEPLFKQHYSHSFHFPGNHTPTADEVRRWYVPLAQQMFVRYV